MKRIRWPAVAAVGVLMAGSGTAYAVTNDGSTGDYRTVRAGKGDVEQVLATSGTVDAAHRADLKFGTSGTVASVAVAVGDTVKAGQVVARLDTAALGTAVTKARASVAQAVARLASDESSQDQAVSTATPSPQTSKPTGKPTGKPTSSASPSASPTTGAGTTAALQQLKAQQAAVVDAQSAATQALAAAKDALAAQTAACADAYQDAPTPPAESTPDPSATAIPAADAACSAALAVVQARQDDVRAAQDTLQQALDTLAGTLSQALATPASPAGGSGNGSGNGSGTPSGKRSSAPSSTSTPSGSTTPTASGSGTTSGPATAAQLAADQAGIEKARADLVDARRQLRQAVLRSTRSGTVVSVPVAVGDHASAGDVGAVVVGGAAVTVDGTVPQTKIAQVKVGDPARVTMPGESGSAAGTVTAIGLVADRSSGTPSYPVTVTVEDPAIPLPSGSQAMLAIVVATAQDVVTLPTSAVSRSGDAAVVRTWDGHTLSRKAVTVGTIGAREVEITGGLAAGDRVVLADLGQAITGAADRINDRGGFSGPVGFKGGGTGGRPGGGPVTFTSGG